MYLHYKPTKADLICGILDCWDPCRAINTSSWFDRYYNYEAETICQSLRKDNSISTVAKKVKEVIDAKLEEAGKEYKVDMDNAERVAAAMINTVKNMK